ncbi:MAG: amino acid ABC transporter substrate-binding protein [Rhodocyclaceae bacterium]|nr:amino acid ABC transporter substrate-binding protein [Rhodocyclaceae bacterium]
MKVHFLMRRILAVAVLATASFTTNAQSLGPTLEKISQRGTIFLGHREAAMPFSFVTAGNENPEGFSIEICGHVIKAIEEKLGKKVDTVPVVMSANSRIMMVKTGMADMECGVTTNTIGRSQQVAFSTTFFVSEVKGMVPVALAGKSLKDMANKRVVTTVGSTADRLIKQASMSRGVSIRSLVGRSHANSMEMLTKGEADVFVADDAILAGMRSMAANPENYVILDEGYSVEPYGIILPKDDPQFKKLVDEVLAGLMKSGEMEKIYNTWFTSPIPPANRNLNYPISPLNKASYANPNDKSVN